MGWGTQLCWLCALLTLIASATLTLADPDSRYKRQGYPHPQGRFGPPGHSHRPFRDPPGHGGRPPGHDGRPSGHEGRPPGYEGHEGRPAGGVGLRQGGECEESITTMNNGQTTCSGQLIFRDEMNDLEQWSNDIQMAGEPDYEFVLYKSSPRNIFLENGIVDIRAFLTEDRYGVGFVSNGTLFVRRCTSDNPDLCERKAFSYNILPPVRSARIHTANSFSFRYGVVEMRVRGPKGDWLYPQLSLKPLKSRYGPHYASGEVRLPSHTGNKFLKEPGTGQKGQRGRKLMRAGIALDSNKYLGVEARASPEVQDWSKVFHVVRMKWTPDDFEFWVDGIPLGRGKIPVPEGGFASLTDSPTGHAWTSGEKNAPFDQEFYLSIGLGVGGLNRFPDNVTNGQNGEYPKPWKNTSPKAMLNFWKAKDQWYPTWQSPNLQVSYVKVWAL